MTLTRVLLRVARMSTQARAGPPASLRLGSASQASSSLATASNRTVIPTPPPQQQPPQPGQVLSEASSWNTTAAEKRSIRLVKWESDLATSSIDTTSKLYQRYMDVESVLSSRLQWA